MHLPSCVSEPGGLELTINIMSSRKHEKRDMPEKESRHQYDIAGYAHIDYIKGMKCESFDSI